MAGRKNDRIDWEAVYENLEIKRGLPPSVIAARMGCALSTASGQLSKVRKRRKAEEAARGNGGLGCIAQVAEQAGAF